MKRGASGGDDKSSRSGKRPKKPRAKSTESMRVKSGDFELDLNKFPDKMRWLLDNEVAPEALWWLPEGDAIGMNKAAFQEQLLEQEFRGNKFSSITRKLNRWGFRRIDDDQRVPKGAIAYSHDFFVQSAIARMRFMKKEEDRKPTAEEEDAKATEESKSSSLRGFLGEAQQRADLGHMSSHLSLAQNHPVNLTGLARILHAPGVPPSVSLPQHHLQPNFLAAQSESQMTAASMAALTSSQLPALPTANVAAELALRNQLTTSIFQQQQLLLQERQQQQQQQQQLLQERQQQLLLEQRQRQLRGLPAAAIGQNPVDQTVAHALMRRGSQMDSSFLPLLQARQPASLGAQVDPRLAAAASQPANPDLARARLSAGGVASLDNQFALGVAGLQQSEAASLDRSGDMTRILLLRQQHEQVEQERLLQLRQQLVPAGGNLAGALHPSPGTAAAAIPQAPVVAKPEAKEEEEQKRGEPRYGGVE